MSARAPYSSEKHSAWHLSTRRVDEAFVNTEPMKPRIGCYVNWPAGTRKLIQRVSSKPLLSATRKFITPPVDRGHGCMAWGLMSAYNHKTLYTQCQSRHPGYRAGGCLSLISAQNSKLLECTSGPRTAPHGVHAAGEVVVLRVALAPQLLWKVAGALAKAFVA